MAGQSRGAATLAGTDRSGNEQIDGNLGHRVVSGGSMRDPHANAVAGLGPEACLGECLLQRRDLAESRRIDSEIAVCGVGCNREIRLADPHVDGVRADEDDRIAVRPEGVERVEKHPPCYDVELIHATFLRSRASTP